MIALESRAYTHLYMCVYICTCVGTYIYIDVYGPQSIGTWMPKVRKMMAQRGQKAIFSSHLRGPGILFVIGATGIESVRTKFSQVSEEV